MLKKELLSFLKFFEKNNEDIILLSEEDRFTYFKELSVIFDTINLVSRSSFPDKKDDIFFENDNLSLKENEEENKTVNISDQKLFSFFENYSDSETLSEITEIDCPNQNLDKIPSLKECLNLKTFYAGNNNLFELDLSNLEYLEEVSCINNNLSFIDLANSKNIKELYLSDNLKLKRIDGLFDLINLEYLNLSNTLLEDIDISIFNKLKQFNGVNIEKEKISFLDYAKFVLKKNNIPLTIDDIWINGQQYSEINYLSSDFPIQDLTAAINKNISSDKPFFIKTTGIYPKFKLKDFADDCFLKIKDSSLYLNILYMLLAYKEGLKLEEIIKNINFETNLSYKIIYIQLEEKSFLNKYSIEDNLKFLLIDNLFDDFLLIKENIFSIEELKHIILEVESREILKKIKEIKNGI